MPPVDFESLCKKAFDEIKCGLGTEVRYQPKAGGIYSIRGVFDDRIQEVDPDTEQVISSNAFTLGIKLDDIPFLPKKGDVVLVKDSRFKVIEVREDGVPDASVVLILHKAD